MQIAIAGGGICGLTLALAAKKAGIVPIVIEQRSHIHKHTFGGGIGLWPPSQLVFEQLGILHKLQKIGYFMPSAHYFNHKGQKLAEPSPHFPKRFKILCLQRQLLTQLLYKQCISQGISIKTQTAVKNATSSPQQVIINLSSGEQISAKALIGADGINSTVRNIIMRQKNIPEVHSTHCGYAYFRAVVDLSKDNNFTPENSHMHEYAFESWGQEKRFGYVPLKQPKTFWFVSIPINKYGLEQYNGSHTCSEQQKKWILELFEHWKAPISIKDLIEQTPADTILRTDIRKIKGVTSFPWHSQHNNILIVGDAANATAPNLAQGAGLAIESAWDLISMVNFHDFSGLKQFMCKRRKRAQTVQNMADWVAKIGHLASPYSNVRDLGMMIPTKFVKGIEEKVFQSAVIHSLGGTSGTLHWLPKIDYSQEKNQEQYPNCLLSNIIGKEQFSKLPQTTQKFRQQLLGQGQATVSVGSSWVSRIFGLSGQLHQKNFGAYVDTHFNQKTNAVQQTWTRIFNQGQKGAVMYSTVHRATPNLNAGQSGLTLTQSLGSGFVKDLIRFGYDIKLLQNRVNYQSIGVWIYNYRLPFPRLFLPTSQWTETQTENGWNFEGSIKYPKILGGSTVFKYGGHFKPIPKISSTGKTVVIAGGSGFIGKSVARVFHKKGWHVTILSRSSKPIYELPFAKVEKWIPEPSQTEFNESTTSLAEILRGKDAVINLSGQNPGSGLRWTEAKKRRILQSRLRSIEVIAEALKKADNIGAMFLQSSATGIYNSRKDEILTQSSALGQPNNFRTNTVLQIQKLTLKLFPQAVCLRIGNVLGSQGQLLQFLKSFSLMRGKKYGAGGQYMPWIHVEDAGQAMLHIVNRPNVFTGKSVNLTSPDHQTYDSIFEAMGEQYNRTPFFRVPEWVFKLILGEISCILLWSQRVHPQYLLDDHFQFQFASIRKALASRAFL